MSTPVVTDKWAGQFDCTGSCRRKRLVGSEFSNKALERYRMNGGPLKCKECIQAAEVAERKAAAARRTATATVTSGISNSTGDSTTEITALKCATCQESLSVDKFNKNQVSKGEGKARCRSCVETAIAKEGQSAAASKEAQMAAARERVTKAHSSTKSNRAMEILGAESALAALEAEHVTGLKPVLLGRGRGRGGRWSSGRGRSTGRGSAG
eukprot:CAMPEP_0198286708 /NCGR_PEP_ID=MMETSP1449-20131203/5705_1 /TAXON_ID=420275 /ORGANISM="Attheya septentrionalis, Strain CCMP2084" /LENGTH=210 /DNA_ID=CAMNT_0043984493 /DNA_START=195 /DNA_END=823 /DNA_ORIENTATION=-